jgi:basic membrane protein A
MAVGFRTALGFLAVLATVAGCASSWSTPSAPTSTLKIGVVTDVGHIDDNGYNQLSYEGAKQAAEQLGATVDYYVPDDAPDYANGVQAFIDEGSTIIVTVGANLGDTAIRAAGANPNIWFVAVDVDPCLDEHGDPDPTGVCVGRPATMLPNLVAIRFEEDQLGYLAGIVAAAVSASGVIGRIGAISSDRGVIRYLQGFELGARWLNPDVLVETGFFSTKDLAKAYDDPVWGKTYSRQFIAQKGVDVVFGAARNTGHGTLDAACEAGILAIGVDVDQYMSYPAAKDCIVASTEKHLAYAVSETILGIDAGTVEGAVSVFGAANDGIGISSFHLTTTAVPDDVQGRLDDALAGMKDGSLITCPVQCGTWP